MRKSSFWGVALLSMIAMSSCDKNDENPELRKDAIITSFTFDNSVEANKIVTSQPVIAGNQISLVVDGMADAMDIAALVPTIKVSEGATYSFQGSFDLGMTYVVTAEDGTTKNTYTATCTGSMFDVYAGVLKVSLDGNVLLENAPYNISLEKEDAGTVQVFISDFSIASELLGEEIALGDVAITGCVATQTDGGYQFSGTKDLGTLELPVNGITMPVDCVINVADAKVVDGTFTLPMVIHVSGMGGQMQMDVDAYFTGTPME